MKRASIVAAALLLALTHSGGAESAEEDVLVLIPFNTKSHKNFMVPLITALAEKGHRVDVVSMFLSPELSNLENVHETVIELGPDAPTLSATIGDSMFYGVEAPFVNFIRSFSHFVNFCEHLMSLELVQELHRRVADRPPYGVVLFDAFMSECFLPLAHLAQAPIVLVAPSHPMPWNYNAIGTTIDYKKDAVFFLPHSDGKSLAEQVQATVLGGSAHLFRDWVHMPRVQRVVERSLAKVLGRRRASSIPPVWRIEADRTALLMVNWHWSMGAFVRANPPTLVEVGTLHCKEAKPIPKDLDDFISKAGGAGFILFSLGSTVPGHSMPLAMQKTFLEAFAELPQSVLWKFERPMELPVPANVLVQPWLPQQDLLADRRLRLFVTQAGMLSLQEAAWHGAPLLAAPLIVDQRANAAMAEAAGIGLKLELHSATKDSLKELITGIITNSSFAEKARRLSVRLRSQPEPASTRAVWWVEHAMRHNGTSHLRPPVAGARLFDVALGLLCVALVAYALSCRTNRSAAKRKVE